MISMQISPFFFQLEVVFPHSRTTFFLIIPTTHECTIDYKAVSLSCTILLTSYLRLHTDHRSEYGVLYIYTVVRNVLLSGCKHNKIQNHICVC